MPKCSECSSSRNIWKTLLNPYKAWPCPACGQPVTYSRLGVFSAQVLPLTLFAWAVTILGPSYWFLALPAYLTGGVLTYLFAPIQTAAEASPG